MRRFARWRSWPSRSIGCPSAPVQPRPSARGVAIREDDAAGGAAGTATFLAYGLNPGSTPVPPLGITLDLAGAQQIGTTVVSDGSGNASFPVAIPPVAAGVVAYLQACQAGMRSNLLTVVIQ